MEKGCNCGCRHSNNYGEGMHGKMGMHSMNMMGMAVGDHNEEADMKEKLKDYKDELEREIKFIDKRISEISEEESKEEDEDSEEETQKKDEN